MIRAYNYNLYDFFYVYALVGKIGCRQSFQSEYFNRISGVGRIFWCFYDVCLNLKSFGLWFLQNLFRLIPVLMHWVYNIFKLHKKKKKPKGHPCKTKMDI